MNMLSLDDTVEFASLAKGHVLDILSAQLEDDR